MNANEHAAEIRRGIAQALEALIEQTGLGRVCVEDAVGHHKHGTSSRKLAGKLPWWGRHSHGPAPVDGSHRIFNVLDYDSLH